MWTESHRPQRLSDIRGQPFAIHQLLSLAHSLPSEIPHFLFYGPCGVGKTTAALAFVREVILGWLSGGGDDEGGVR